MWHSSVLETEKSSKRTIVTTMQGPCYMAQ
jgi:hypothetical protein